MSPEHDASAKQPTGFQPLLEAVFHEALAAPEAQRPSLLAFRCDGDATLADEVLSLLEAYQGERALAAHCLEVPPAGEAPSGGTCLIGPYQLDRLLGHGGMGAVYLAHRIDGQFQQRVAVKLIDQPLATDLFRERFRLERQILAGLTHPYIAHLLDGGVTEDGELYLVMEYVDGIPIGRFCREHRLLIRERLLLFLKVCTAVQFAHQNLVVHRDLKSDNILVLEDGTPRLLDFGTAKLLATVPDASTTTEFTRLGLQAFTPNYASPEQVMGEAITTASDTYSLGVLLYLMLAEVPPYLLKTCSMAELLRVICTEPPPRPSTTSMTSERLDADLDAIVLKAMRKEPQERYRSVEAFASDIRAFLDGRPVLARRGDRRYRAGKFLRRNRLAMGAAALVLLSLVAGLAGALWQYRVATVERRRAESSVQDMRQLSNSLLSEIDEAVKQLPGSTPVRQLLVGRVLEHLDRLAKDRSGDRLTQLDLIRAYTRLGNLQGHPYDQNIGDRDGALVSLDKALFVAKRLNGRGGSDLEVMGPLALAEQSRSEVLFGLGRTQESMEAMRAAVAAFDARIAGPRPTAITLAEAASAYGGLGDQLGQSGVASLGDPEGAIQAYRKGLELSLRSLQVDPGFTRSKRALALDHFKIGNILVETDPVKAMAEYHQSLAAWEALPARDKEGAATQRGIASAYRKLALALTEMRNYPSAIAAFKRARDIYERYAAADPKDTRAQFDLAIELSNEAQTFTDLLNPALNPSAEGREERTRRAADLMDRSIRIMQRLVAIDPANQGWAGNLAYEKVLAGTLRPGRHGAELGSQWAASGLAFLRTSAQKENSSIPTLDHAASALLSVQPARLRDPRLSRQLAEQLVTLTHHRKPSFLLLLAQASQAAGRLELAQAAAREGLSLLAPSLPGAVKPRLRKLLEDQAEGSPRS